MRCGKPDLPAHLSQRLALLGQAIDSNIQLSVFDRGFVGFSGEDESEVMKNVAEGKDARRSAARSWERRQSAQCSRWRSAGALHPGSSDAHEQAFGTDFRVLSRHYAALGFEDSDGLWVAVLSAPLGGCGPHFEMLVGLAFDRRVPPKAWSFEKIGNRLQATSLRHTNFPDASICAFINDGSAWKPEDGLIRLIDIYSVWLVKKLYCEKYGTWPGEQYGACALYRRLEFSGSEQCGCRSGKLYKDCHAGQDKLVSETAAKEEFRRLFRCDYTDRAVPEAIVKAARTGWKVIPPLRSVVGNLS